MNIGLLLIAIIGGTAGIASTLYLLFSFPIIIIWKIYRKIAKGIPLQNNSIQKSSYKERADVVCELESYKAVRWYTWAFLTPPHPNLCKSNTPRE